MLLWVPLGQTTPLVATSEAELTELGGNDGEVVPGVLLAVQLPQDVDRAITGVHVEDSVHVGPPVDGVPAMQRTRRRGRS